MSNTGETAEGLRAGHAGATRLLRWTDGVAGILVFLATICLAATAILTVLDVVLRNTIGMPVPGMIDITQLAMMYTIFPCIAYAFSRRAHVAVTVLADMMPLTAARTLAIIGWALGAAVCAYLAFAVWAQARMIWTYGDVSQNMHIPMIWYWFPIVAGLALSALAAVAAIFSEAADGSAGGAHL